MIPSADDQFTWAEETIARLETERAPRERLVELANVAHLLGHTLRATLLRRAAGE